MSKFTGLTIKEISVLAIHCGLVKTKIKDNFKEIMYNHLPGEYSREDDLFFGKYKGKEVLAYPFNKNYKDDDWFILAENNHVLSRDCFDYIEGE